MMNKLPWVLNIKNVKGYLKSQKIQGLKFTTIDINCIFYALLMMFVNENLKKTFPVYLF